MDQPRNRPSRPRLRTHNNSARVLVFDQAEPDQATGKMEPEIPRRLLSTSKVESKEAPVRPGFTNIIYNRLFLLFPGRNLKKFNDKLAN